MKFDIFDAMKMMQAKFGADDNSITVFNRSHEYHIRLDMYHVGLKEVFRNQFVVSKREMNDSNVRIFNKKFDKALFELDEHIKNALKQSSE